MWYKSLDTRGQFLSKTRPQIIYWQITVSRMYDRVFIFRHVFFKAIPVCFSIQGNHPAFCLVNVALILPSKNTASWSLIPGMTWVLTIRLSLLVINKSTTFLPRVGLVIISWTQPWSSRQSANFRVNSGKRHVGNTQLCFQSNPGRFMSPAIRIWDEVQICDEVSHSNRWSDLSKFFLLLRAWTPNLLDEANW